MKLYISNAGLSEKNLCFVAEDDLFIADSDGSNPRRIVSNLGVISDPIFFPEGNGLAFRVLRGAGPSINEIFTCGLDGENLTQVTFLGSMVTGIAGWKKDGELIIYSDIYEANRGSTQFYIINLKTGLMTPANLGYGHRVQISEEGTLLGRNTFEVPYWKNYRGGTRGKLWFKAKNEKIFKPIVDMETGIHSQYLHDGSIYFVTDRDGEANVYSFGILDGIVKKLTHFKTHGVRTMGHYKDKLIFTVAGELWTYSLNTGKEKKIELNIHAQGKRSGIKYLDSGSNLESAELFDEENVGVLVRGRGVLIGKNKRNPVYLNKEFNGRIRGITRVSEDLFACIYEINGEDGIITCTRSGSLVKEYPMNKGLLLRLKSVPRSRKVIFSNNRFELFILDLDEEKASVIDKSEAARILEFDISSDGKLVAYGFALSNERQQIRIFEISTGKKVNVTSSSSVDYSPSFERSGSYLNFISNRNLDPTYDKLFFSLGFMTISKPYAVTLSKDLQNPFVGELPTLPDGKDKENKSPVKYDLEGLEKRVQAFPLEPGNYEKIVSARGKVFYLKLKIEGSMGQYNTGPSHKRTGTLMEFDFTTRQERKVQDGVSNFSLSQNGDKLLLSEDGKLFITGIDLRPDDPDMSRKILSLASIHDPIDTLKEYTQMFNETWKFMREGYWNPDKLKNWGAVKEKYSSLLPLIQTRSELSDLLKKMQGELGTSHSYEVPMKITDATYFPSGRLGAMLEDSSKGSVIVKKIFMGDPANEGEKSPLHSSGVNVEEGDIISEIDNVPIHSSMELYRVLVNKGDDLAQISVRKKNGKEHVHEINLIPNQKKLMYRDWVEDRKAYVHLKSNGTCGYIHIPDMGPAGYAEFFRLLSEETERNNLIIDVRYNGGGHVSSILLGMLNRKLIGKDVTRWGRPEPYPQYSVSGKMVCVTNEFAGSDGDIFSHSWKLMKLGELVGTRTWGGVVGINPISNLIDGTLVTQPEYAFTFNDVGFGVENYGTDPTIEVNVTPEEFSSGSDPQLDRAISILMK